MRTLLRFVSRGCVAAVAMLAAGVVSARDVVADERADTLVVAMSSLHEGTFLPWNGGGARKFYLDVLYEYLVYLDPETGAAQPGLATKWEMAPDGKTWTLWLRQGVQFRDGYGELTAEDVKFSLERIIDPKSIVGPASSLRKLIAKVEAPEKYKVVISLNVPDIEFLRGYLSNSQMVGIVSKKHLEAVGEEAANERPVGTGAYAMVEYRKGLSIKLKTADGADKHWRVRPAFQFITFLTVPEEGTRVAMLRAGEADLAPVGYDSVPAIKKAGLNVFSLKSSWSPVIRLGGQVQTNEKFNNPNVPWAKKEVRQALNYAVDRDAIVRSIFHGEAVPAATDVPAAEYKGLAAYPYDPKKAKQLLVDAGYPNGFEITIRSFTTTPGAELPVIAEAVALYWQAIGVKVKIVPIDWASMRSAWTTGKANDVVWTHRGLYFTNPYVAMETAYTSKNVFASFATTETEARIADIANELDRDKRSEKIRKMGEYLRDEAGNVFIVYANEPYGASQKLKAWPSISEHVTNLDQITRQ